MTANPLSNVPPIGPASNIGPPNPPGRFKPVDPLKLLRQHMRTLIVTCIIGLVLGVGTWALLRIYDPHYTSEAQLLVKSPPNAEDPLQSDTNNGRDVLERYMETQVQRLKFDKIIDRAISQDNVRQTQWFKQFNGDLREARQTLQEDTFSAFIGRGTRLLELRATTQNKNDAPELLTAIINAYLGEMEFNVKESDRELRQVLLDKQERESQDVARLKEDLAQFTRNNDLDTLNNRSSSSRLEYESLTQQRLDMEYALSESKATYESLKASQKGDAEPPPEITEQIRAVPEFQRRRERLNQIKSNYQARLQSGYGPEHRSMRQLKEQINAQKTANKKAFNKRVQERLAASVSSSAQTVANLKSRLSSLAPEVNEARQRMTDLTAKLQQHEQLQHELEGAQERRDKAREQLTQLRVRGQHPNAVRVKRSAYPSQAELTSPLPQVVVPGVTILILGLVGGFLFLREMLDQGMRSPSDVKLLPNATLLGMLPDTNEDPSGSQKVERIVQNQPAGLMAESYRQVRTAILSRMDRRGYKTLVLVAARPGSGTTSTIYNLAFSLAFNGRRVVIVDGNFRRPGQSEQGEMSNDQGLADVLLHGHDVTGLVQEIGDTGVSILPTGQTDNAPPELLEGKAFRAMIGRLETDYDMVLIDAPPALLSSEAQLLAKQVDAIAIIARAGRDKRGMIERMTNQLDGQRADILGIILNGVRSAAGGYFRKTYQDFYRYRQDDSKSAKRRDRKKADRTRQDSQAEALEAVAAQDSTNGQPVDESGNGHAVDDDKPLDSQR